MLPWFESRSLSICLTWWLSKAYDCIQKRCLRQKKEKLTMNNEDYWWPMLHFGPVNLWTVMDAHSFYSSQKEQEERIWREYNCDTKRVGVRNIAPSRSPTLRQMKSFIACR